MFLNQRIAKDCRAHSGVVAGRQTQVRGVGCCRYARLSPGKRVVHHAKRQREVANKATEQNVQHVNRAASQEETTEGTAAQRQQN